MTKADNILLASMDVFCQVDNIILNNRKGRLKQKEFKCLLT